ncbi:MAG TPA: CorA family divalent cation transporter [Polyangiaceae bacterium]|nr:CorA family divalent cation transporter [Polyangiaceae bacterium]
MASLIPETWGVPEKFKQRLGTSAGRQRAMIDSGHLLLILHGLPQPGEAERTPRLFWRNPAGEWRATGAKGDGLKALKELLEQYRKRVAELDDLVDTSTSAQQLFQVIRFATPIARAARHQHRALQEAREGIDHRDLIVLRDIAGDIERSIELVASDAKNALDYVDAKEAEAQTALARKATDAQHRLNLIAALFLPITAVGSVLGVNLRSGLEGQSPALYWAVVVIALVTGFVVRASVTRGERAAP